MATPATESGIHMDKELLQDGPELPNARSSTVPREQNACRIDRWLGASRRVRSASLFVLGPYIPLASARLGLSPQRSGAPRLRTTPVADTASDSAAETLSGTSAIKIT